MEVQQAWLRKQLRPSFTTPAPRIFLFLLHASHYASYTYILYKCTPKCHGSILADDDTLRDPAHFASQDWECLQLECWCAQASAEGGARTVVVFEEVDNLADADRGFLAALAGLIADSKVRSLAF